MPEGVHRKMYECLALWFRKPVLSLAKEGPRTAGRIYQRGGGPIAGYPASLGGYAGEKTFLLTSCRVRHIWFPSRCLGTIEDRHRAKLLEHPANIVLSGQKGMIING